MAEALPPASDKEAWCKEKLEFICAVVDNADRQSLQAQLTICETEDEAEAILQSLLWSQDLELNQEAFEGAINEGATDERTTNEGVTNNQHILHNAGLNDPAQDFFREHQAREEMESYEIPDSDRFGIAQDTVLNSVSEAYNNSDDVLRSNDNDDDLRRNDNSYTSLEAVHGDDSTYISLEDVSRENNDYISLDDASRQDNSYRSLEVVSRDNNDNTSLENATREDNSYRSLEAVTRDNTHNTHNIYEEDTTRDDIISLENVNRYDTNITTPGDEARDDNSYRSLEDETRDNHTNYITLDDVTREDTGTNYITLDDAARHDNATRDDTGTNYITLDEVTRHDSGTKNVTLVDETRDDNSYVSVEDVNTDSDHDSRGVTDDYNGPGTSRLGEITDDASRKTDECLNLIHDKDDARGNDRQLITLIHSDIEDAAAVPGASNGGEPITLIHNEDAAEVPGASKGIIDETRTQESREGSAERREFVIIDRNEVEEDKHKDKIIAIADSSDEEDNVITIADSSDEEIRQTEKAEIPPVDTSFVVVDIEGNCFPGATAGLNSDENVLEESKEKEQPYHLTSVNQEIENRTPQANEEQDEEEVYYEACQHDEEDYEEEEDYGEAYGAFEHSEEDEEEEDASVLFAQPQDILGDEELARQILDDLAREERERLEADERLARQITEEMEREEALQEAEDARLARELSEGVEAQDQGEPEEEEEIWQAEEEEVEIRQADEVVPIINPFPVANNILDEANPGPRRIPVPAIRKSITTQRIGNPGPSRRPEIGNPIAMQRLANPGPSRIPGMHTPITMQRLANPDPSRIPGMHTPITIQRLANPGPSRIPGMRTPITMQGLYGQTIGAHPTAEQIIQDEAITRELSEEGAVAKRSNRQTNHAAEQIIQDEAIARELSEEGAVAVLEDTSGDEEMARRLEEEEQQMFEQNKEEEEDAGITQQLVNLMTMFPDADPQYLRERCDGTVEFDKLVDELLQLQQTNPKDPRMSGHLKRQREAIFGWAKRHKSNNMGYGSADTYYEEGGAGGSVTYECTICFEEEVPADSMATCNGLLRNHLFCIECVRKHVGAQIGLGNNRFKCLDGYCEAEFTSTTLARVMEPIVLQKVLERRQTEEVAQAGIEDLVACPFCNFMVIMPDPHNKVLECLNPECLKESCRQCREVSHIPLRCEEVEHDNQKDARTYLEKKMSEALIRTCPKCQKSIVSEGGCNRMTCPCGTVMCYVCKQVIPNNYDHFSLGRCPQSSNLADLHLNNVRTAAEQARREVDPNITLVHDPTQGVL